MSLIPDTAAIPPQLMPQEVSLPVREIFAGAVQSGFYSGLPAVFVRLQGCNVGCPWCDQPQTWDVPEPGSGRPEVPEEAIELGAGRHSSPGYRHITVTRLLALLATYSRRHVVITGGEPSLHDLLDLTNRLIAAGHSVQIETAGTMPLQAHDDCFVTLSPKHRQPGGLWVLEMAWARADEVVQVITGPEDRTLVSRAIMAAHHGTPVFLVPEAGMDPDQGWALCWSLAQEFGVRLGLPLEPRIGADVFG